MSLKTIFRIVMVIGIAVVGFLTYQNWSQQNALSTGNGLGITDLGNMWGAEEEIAAAKERLSANPEEAQVITTDISGTPQVALVLDGMPNRVIAAKIVDLLSKYDTRAAFFIEGQNAADNIEIMKLLSESKQSVGNYTFVGVSHFEKLPVDAMLSELCRGQKAINVQTAVTPTMFRAPNTNYTPDVLKAVNAAGIQYAVKSNITVNMSAINSFPDAQAFAASVPMGSILSIPLGTPVEVPAQEAGKIDERPAIDKKPTIVDPDTKTPPQTGQKADTVQRLEWLIVAFQQKGVKLSDVASFRKIKYIPAGQPVPPVNNAVTTKKTP